MTQLMILCGVVILVCITSSKIVYRFGVPALFIFLLLGMLFGSDGIGGIYFDNYELAQELCSLGLIFIMFYGGFVTNWKVAKPVAMQAVLLSSLGTAITAGLTGLFCHLVLRTTLLEGFLIGSVVASTDAASVFSILRSRELNLKGGLASLLEVESGSNDPFAYMLTIVVLSFINNSAQGSVFKLLTMQIVFGVGMGIILASLTIFVLNRIKFEIDGVYPIFVTAIVVLGFALSDLIGGNGFLCAYVTGIILGNSKITHKKSLVHFFDGISWLMQIMLFFTLGLLSFPSQMKFIIVPGILVSLFLIIVARPVAVFSILSWFKIPVKQQLFVSWVGLRGAASIVFAIFVVTNDVSIKNDIFHIIFFVALFSVLVQGSLIPYLSKKLDLVEPENSVLKTFNDYEEELHTELKEYLVEEDSPWLGKTIMDANIDDDILVVMIKRNKDIIIPNGSTMICEGDIMVLTANNFDNLQTLESNLEI